MTKESDDAFALRQQRALWTSRSRSADAARREEALAQLRRLDALEHQPNSPPAWAPPTGASRLAAPGIPIGARPTGAPLQFTGGWTEVAPHWPIPPRAPAPRRIGAFALDALCIAGALAALNAAVPNHLGLWELLVVATLLVLPEGSKWGQTVGKRVFGIRLVDRETGGVIGLDRALMRSVGRIFSVTLLGVGYLCAFWDRDRQTLHDKVADSVVIRATSRRVRSEPPTPR